MIRIYRNSESPVDTVYFPSMNESLNREVTLYLQFLSLSSITYFYDASCHVPSSDISVTSVVTALHHRSLSPQSDAKAKRTLKQKHCFFILAEMTNSCISHRCFRGHTTTLPTCGMMQKYGEWVRIWNKTIVCFRVLCSTKSYSANIRKILLNADIKCMFIHNLIILLFYKKGRVLSL